MGPKLVKMMTGIVFYFWSVYSAPGTVLSYLALESDCLGLKFGCITHQLCDLKTTSQLLHFKTADVTSAYHKGLLRGLNALTHRKYLNHISLNTCYYVLIFKTALPKV